MGYMYNGQECTRTEYVLRRRDFYGEQFQKEITDKEQLIDLFERICHCSYEDAGDIYTHWLCSMSFSSREHFLDNLTDSEKVLWEEVYNDDKSAYEAEKAKYDWENFKGRPLTEEEVVMFLDREIKQEAKFRGEDNFWTKELKKSKEAKLEKFRNGEVIEVASNHYTAAYGNGTGDFSDVLFSDGTVRTACYGYSD